jgi:hypothetical protein
MSTTNSRQIGLQRGRKYAQIELQRFGTLTLNRQSLIHFANGMCYYSVLVQSGQPIVDGWVDEFVEGFVEGYSELIQRNEYLAFYFKS